jgi:O-antigen/teichoic acid export membrane protein
MGTVTALRFVEGIYRSSILGLQLQVRFNVVSSAMATLRAFGSVAIIVLVSPTIQGFFLWQGAVSILTLLMFARMTYRALPKADYSGRFSLQALQGIMHFAGGMLSITFLSLLLMQVDKVMLSKLLNLSEYGHYMLASAVAGAVLMLGHPIVQAWYPRLNELYAQNDVPGFIKTYHQGAQLISVCVGGAVVVLAVFAEQILYLWTRDFELAHRTATLVSLLVLGNALNALMFIPYQAQLVYGWTGLATRINIVAVIAIIPAVLWVTPHYGAEGAAWVWVGLNMGYLLIGVHFMYSKILKNEKWSWYKNDLIQPIGAAIITALIANKLISLDLMPKPAQLLALVGISAIVLMMAGLAAPIIRKKMRAQLVQLASFLNIRSL